MPSSNHGGDISALPYCGLPKPAAQHPRAVRRSATVIPLCITPRDPRPIAVALAGPEVGQSEEPSPFKESWLVGPSNTRFYSRVYAPPSPVSICAVIVFIHGFAEHIERYTHFHRRLPEHGIAVFAFDQRGFGRTSLDVQNRSPDSVYGNTSWKDQIDDIQWAIDEANKGFPEIPIFLMGHSMGGSEVLGFATQKATAAVDLFGVIATSPLIHLLKPVPKLVRWVGRKASIIAPHTPIEAKANLTQLSHNPAVGEAYLKDSLTMESGSLRGITDLMDLGDKLFDTDYKQWPESLPVLFAHGSADQVTSCEASKAFYDKIPAKHKDYQLFSGEYHELHNESQEVQDRLKDDIVEFIHAHAKPKL